MIALAHIPALEAKAHLEASIHALFGEEQTLTALHDTTGVKKSKRRVWIGGNLFQLRRTIKERLRQKWTTYLNSGVLPFEYHTAYDYIDEWWLYYHGGDEYNFEKFSKMRTSEIRREAHQLRGTLHSDQIGDRLQAEREANTTQLVRVIVNHLSPADLIDTGDLIARGWVPATFEELMLDAVPRQEAA
jgi:hypothetical protein